MSISLKNAFRAQYGSWDTEEIFSGAEISGRLKELYEKQSSWEWRFGETPEFDMSFETRFSWGGFEVSLSAKKGRIREIGLYTDAMDAELAELLKDSLRGCRLSFDEISDKIKTSVALLAAGGSMLADPAQVSRDLCGWFAEIL